jgi:hypothetical protein
MVCKAWRAAFEIKTTPRLVVQFLCRRNELRFALHGTHSPVRARDRTARTVVETTTAAAARLRG